MPPKKSLSSKRKSTNKVSEQILPIYQILTNFDNKEFLSELMPQIQTSLQENPQNLKVSFLKMLIGLCGLEQFTLDIDPDDTTISLESIIEKAYESNTKISTPLILNSKSKFKNQLLKRLRQFYRVLLSDQLNLINDQKVQFNQSFLNWLQILTQVKIRVIRYAAIIITKIFVEQEIKYYQKLHQQKKSKKAFNVSKKISYFLQKVISKRLNDIDSKIRQTAFNATQTIFIELQSELLTQNMLNKLLSTMFDEDIVIVQSTLTLILNLLNKCKKINHLVVYLLDKRQKLQDISRNSNYTGSDSLKIIGILHKHKPEKKLFNKTYVVNLLETYSKQNSFINIHTAIDVFYNSLQDSQQKLEQHCNQVLHQVLQLLTGVTNSKYLNLILRLFFTSNRKVDSNKIFNIDNMFLLLMDGKYPQLILTVIYQYIKHASESFFHLKKDKKVYQQILQKYNNHILIHCKEIFFQKMPIHKEFSQKYLRLFTCIHLPTLNHGALQNYLSFVIDKINLLFISQVTNYAIFKQIVNIYFNLYKAEDSDLKYNAKNIILKIDIESAINPDILLTVQQIYKITAVLMRFSIYELTTSTSFLGKCIKFFAQTKNNNQKFQLLLLCHYIHHRNFMDLIEAPSQRSAEIYKNIRNIILQFFLQVLNEQSQSSIVKLNAFRCLTSMLKQISNSKFQQLERVRTAHQLTSEEMKIVYDYIFSQMGYNITERSSSLDKSLENITSMFSSLSFQDHQIKIQILKLLFSLYENSYAFTCNGESSKFITFLIKGQMQLQKQSFNAKHFVSIVQINRLIERSLSTLLNHYITEELKPSNQNKLIYWRLVYEILQVSRQDDKFDIILERLLNTYLSNKRTSPEITKRINNKLMIFTLTAVDKILEKKQYIHLDIYQNILRRISRRFPKQTLIRIKEFYTNKTQDIDSPYLKSFIDLLGTISKVATKKSKKQQQAKSQESGESQEESENGQMQMRNPQQNRKNKRTKRESNRIMEIQQQKEEEQNFRENQRTTRSQTKKKIK